MSAMWYTNPAHIELKFYMVTYYYLSISYYSIIQYHMCDVYMDERVNIIRANKMLVCVRRANFV